MNARQDIVGLVAPAVAERHVMHVARSREAGISLARVSKGYPVLIIMRIQRILVIIAGLNGVEYPNRCISQSNY